MKRTDNLDLAYQIFDQCLYATLSLTQANGTPYAVPVSPVRDGDILYFHGALEGQKTRALHHQPRVCVTCVGQAQVVSDQFTISYQSVTAFGLAEEITCETEKGRALMHICRHYCPADMATAPAEMAKFIHRTAVWKITLDTITTKG